jgi:membrane protein CcdC involved in cytochrome C biogenesis
MSHEAACTLAVLGLLIIGVLINKAEELNEGSAIGCFFLLALCIILFAVFLA